MTATIIGEAGAVLEAFDIINHGRPYWLMMATVALLCAFAARRGPGRWVLISACCIVVAMQGRFIISEARAVACASESAAPAHRLRIATFNAAGDWARPADVLAWVSRTNIDVIALEEAGVGGRPLVEALRGTFPHAVTLPGRPVSVLSRYTLTGRIVSPQTHQGTRIVPHAAIAEIAPPGGARPLTIIGTHLGWPAPLSTGQVQQLEWLVDRARDERADILLGDFNSTPWSWTLRRFEANLGLRRATSLRWTSWPAVLPFIGIDHVFLGAPCVIVGGVGPDLGSDHRPIWMEIGW